MKILVSRSSDPDYLFQLGSIYNQIGNTREGWALIRKAAKQGQPEAARLVKTKIRKGLMFRGFYKLIRENSGSPNRSRILCLNCLSKSWR